MKALLNKILRGPFASRLLKACGVNPVHYWLLVDLFGRLSERSEFMTQLGRSGIALKTMAWLYFVFLSATGIILVFARLSPPFYLSIFLGVTALFLLALLVSETNNSLVNPEEGLVLAHQPIDGATYSAAKLSHLARILLYIVPALNGVPALAGLALPGAPWFYPFLHMAVAFAIGLLMGLFSCALFGWLIRFVPAPSLKTAGKWTELTVWMSFIWLPQTFRFLPRLRSAVLTMPEWLLVVLAVVVVLLIVGSLIMGLRSLSVDYMLRVSSIVHGSLIAGRRPRRRRKASAVSAWFGGQPGRAAFQFVLSMMPREWHFIRQAAALVPLLIFVSFWVVQGVGVSPFSGHFSRWHVFPHVFGLMFYMICSIISYGDQYKGSWIFLLAPAGALERFAYGVFGLLWIGFVLAPHLLAFAFLASLWGAGSTAVFIAYSLAVGTFYLALTLRLIEGVPFTRQPQVSGNYMMFPMLLAGTVVMSGAVALQYFFVFRSVAAVLGTTALVAAAAWFLTRSSLDRLAGNMRFTLGLDSGESSFLYKEVIV
jgi:hypothetical protein